MSQLDNLGWGGGEDRLEPQAGKGKRRFSRRDFLKSATALGALAAAGGTLAGCRTNPPAATTGTGDPGASAPAAPAPTTKAAPPPVTKNLPAERKIRQIELLVSTADYDPVRYELGLMTAENWRKMGFDVKVTPMEFNSLTEKASRNHDFDSYTIRRGGRVDTIDPDRYVYGFLHSSQVNKGQENSPGYQSKEYDQYAELQRTTMDPAKRKEAVFKCQEIMGKDQPFTPIFSRSQLLPYNDRDWSDWQSMMGEGMNSLWNFVQVKPKTDRKILKWGYPSDVSVMNPLATTNTHDFWTLRLIYDRLVQIDLKGVAQPWAAQEVKPIDNTTIQVKIRSGMKFHDGKPVTAEDVKFSFEYPAKIKSGYFMGLVGPIASIEVVDDSTLNFKLKTPSAPFIANTLGQVFIIPKHIWQDIPEKVNLSKAQDYPNDKPVGSGMFKLEYWRRNEELKLVRNDAHWVRPNIEAILKIPYANSQGMVAGIQTGECDFAGDTIEPLQAQQLKQVQSVKILDVKDHGFYQINYNNTRKPFDDVAVRYALAYGIAKSAALERLLEGHGEVVHSMITPANEYWHNPNVQKFDLDLEKGKKVLADAGYAWDEKGALYYPEGKKDS